MREARAAVEMGASVVVAQGREAGGHGLRYYGVFSGDRWFLGWGGRELGGVVLCVVVLSGGAVVLVLCGWCVGVVLGVGVWWCLLKFSWWNLSGVFVACCRVALVGVMLLGLWGVAGAGVCCWCWC